MPFQMAFASLFSLVIKLFSIEMQIFKTSEYEFKSINQIIHLYQSIYPTTIHLSLFKTLNLNYEQNCSRC